MDSDATRSRPGKRARNLGAVYQHPVMLDCILRPRCSDDSRFADTSYAYTSCDDKIVVDFMAAAPPMISYFLFDSIPSKDRPACDSQEGRWLLEATAVAAHRSSILLRFPIRSGTGRHSGVKEEFFLYRARTLKKLPECGHGRINLSSRKNIGMVCHEDGEFVVAHLGVLPNKKWETDTGGNCPVTAKLCILRKGSWRTTRCMPILHAKGEGEDLEDLVWWNSDAVIPFGDFICWVDYLRGILLCNVFSSDTELKYVPLPVNSYQGRTHPELGGRGPLDAYRSVCVTGNGSCAAIRFVDVAPTHAWFYGHQGFPRRYPAITTWTLAADMMTWMEDAMMTENELYALATQHDLPSSQPECPLVDVNDPHCVYLALGEGSPSRLVSVNMMRKTLSVIPCEIRSSASSDICGNRISCNLYTHEPFIPCEYWDYLDPYAPNTRNKEDQGRTSFGA